MRFNLLKNKEKSSKIKNFKNTNSNKKSREKSHGRSMVEMLGVLAIIGVLSIGGISGYTIAMRKHKINEITNAITKYAFISYAGFQSKVNNNPDFATLTGYTENPNMINIYECKERNSQSSRDIWGCVNTEFSRSGLGNLPNSVLSIGATSIGVDINGNTVIVFIVSFKEKNSDLCKQVNKALGTYYGSDNNDEQCEGIYGNILFTNGIIVDTDNDAGIETANSTSYDSDSDNNKRPYVPAPDNNKTNSSYSAD